MKFSKEILLQEISNLMKEGRNIYSGNYPDQQAKLLST
jgi:hypothetical protein